MPRPPAPGRLVLRSLDEAAIPVFALDGGRQIVFANRALGEWIGIDPQELVGKRCDYHAPTGNDALQAVCAALCPPPEAFAGQIETGFVSRLEAAEKPFERRAVRFLQLPGKDTAINDTMDGSLLVVIQPADEGHAKPAEPAIAPERLHAILLKLRSDLGHRFHSNRIIGESEAIIRVRQQIRVAAEACARVLIVGPKGSGREHVARTIHFAQNAASLGPLVPIDCSLVDAEQMQSSLTSLLRRQYESPTDRPPAALLLDVDRLRPDAQQELAGFMHLPKVELHTLATARVSLQRLAAKGKFRRDLAYELSTLTIALPSLAKRRVDIPLLAQHVLEEANAAGGAQLSGFHPAAMELLAGLPWKGNVAELTQAVREACEKASGPRILLADLPDWVHLAKDAASRPERDEQPIQLDKFLADIEKELLARALRRARGNKSKAAQLLGLTRQRLLRRLTQLGLIGPAEMDEPVVFEPLPDEP